MNFFSLQAENPVVEHIRVDRPWAPSYPLGMTRNTRRNGTVRLVGRWNYRNIREEMDKPLGAQRALLRLYSFQTEDEQAGAATQRVNARGFSKADAEYLTKAAKWVIKTAADQGVDPFATLVISADQFRVLRVRLNPYANQLADYANRREAEAAKAQRAQAQSRQMSPRQMVDAIGSTEEWEPPSDADIEEYYARSRG